MTREKALILFIFLTAPFASGAAIVPLGSGSYTDSLPGGWPGPVNNVGTAVFPQVTGAFTQIPTTNKWWGSFMWKYYNGNSYGVDMYPWPWAMQPFNN